MPRSSLSISRVMVSDIFRSIRTSTDDFNSPLKPEVSPFTVARRHSLIAETKTLACALSGSSPRLLYKSSSDPPDQNKSSNSSAPRFCLRIRVILSKMMAQHQTDAPISSSITAFTTGSAIINKPNTDISRACAEAVARFSSLAIIFSLSSFYFSLTRNPQLTLSSASRTTC